MCACACVHLIQAPLLFFCSRLASISARLYNKLTPHCQTDGAQTIVDGEEQEEEVFLSNKSHPTVTVFVLIRMNFAWREVTAQPEQRPTGGWCSWGSLINSSASFISSLMDLVSAYQGFDYLPQAMWREIDSVDVCVCLCVSVDDS